MSIVPSKLDGSGSLQSRLNARVAVICVLVFSGMIGAAFASVPLYKRFCQLTGFDGTVRQAEAAPTTVLERPITIRFDTNVRDLPWSFKAEQVSQTLKIGSTGLAFFKVTNTSDKVLTGRATYNVVPESAGAYFQKLECFCFTEQTLKPGQSIDFPVVYFVDPKFATERNYPVLHLLPGCKFRRKAGGTASRTGQWQQGTWRQA
ncbi:MAG: hypothetical protein RLZZ141_1350 [Pseudomonadota bacterium]